jgi:hypothetical protein
LTLRVDDHAVTLLAMNTRRSIPVHAHDDRRAGRRAEPGRTRWSRAAGAALVVGLLLTGCGTDGERRAVPPGTPATTVPDAVSAGPTMASPTGDSAPPTVAAGDVDWGRTAAAPAGTVGPEGSCRIPGSFGIAARWAAQDMSKLGVVDEGLAMRCEVDGNPAGVVGVLRVWVAGDGSTPRAVLEKFVRKSALRPTEVAYRETKVGTVTGVEVSYRFEHHATRAFAVPAGAQVLLVIWGAEEEHFDAGLPAYVLARSSYRPAS